MPETRRRPAARTCRSRSPQNSNLPEVDYLILLDKLYVLSYAFVVLTMAVIVKNSWVDAEGDVATATKADRRGLLWLMAGYVVGVVLIFALTLG